MKNRLKNLSKKIKKEEPTPEEPMPRITNETVAVHREEVLGSARKFIYPLQHSKHRVILVSTALFLVSLVVFFTYAILALYRFQSSSTFIYRVTQVVPFPIARSGSRIIAYENYLFELRRYKHYYETQQKVNFNTEEGKPQLQEYKKRALEKVVNDALVKQLASENNVSVKNEEIDNVIETLRSQNRLGGSEEGFEDILKDSFGWTISDFRRSLYHQLLAQKLIATLDTETRTKAEDALAQLKQGADFAELAKQVSEDQPTQANGGEFGFLISKNSREVTPQTVNALFNLQPNTFSDIINTGYGLEIVKVNEITGDKIKASHILFNFKDIDTYLNDLKSKQLFRQYIRL